MRFYDLDRLDNRDPEFVRNLLDNVVPVIEGYFRPTYGGFDKIPEGSGLYVANHNMGPMTLDTFLVGAAIVRAKGIDALPYGMAHDKAFRLPGLNQLAGPMGAVRGCQENGRRLLEAGKKLLVYPGGASECMRPFRERYRIKFSTSRGYIRLALRNGVPIIPIVTAGAHSTFMVLDDMPWLAKALRLDKTLRLKSWPLCLSFPWGLTVGPPPVFVPLPARIHIEALDPIHFDRSGEEAANDEAYVARCKMVVESRMQEALTRLSPKAGFRNTIDAPAALARTDESVAERLARRIGSLTADLMDAVENVAGRWSGPRRALSA